MQASLESFKQDPAEFHPMGLSEAEHFLSFALFCGDQSADRMHLSSLTEDVPLIMNTDQPMTYGRVIT